MTLKLFIHDLLANSEYIYTSFSFQHIGGDREALSIVKYTSIYSSRRPGALRPQSKLNVSSSRDMGVFWSSFYEFCLLVNIFPFYELLAAFQYSVILLFFCLCKSILIWTTPIGPRGLWQSTIQWPPFLSLEKTTAGVNPTWTSQ